ncbi:hypothetical protein FDA52_00715 [Clostridium botulinum]|nr:hypothetical protein [Clostridium botulinum]
MKKEQYHKLSKYMIIIFSAIVMIAMCFVIKPNIYGDGQEYALMTQAFENHFSPDVSKLDIAAGTDSYNYNFILNREDGEYPYGFFTSNYEKNYSYHFWLYSLLVMPIKLILGLLKANQLRCFQIFNAIIYILTLLYTYKKLKISEKSKFFIITFLIVNPALYYIVWTHPEIFTFSLVCISLVMHLNKEYEKAIFTVSVASMQNQPIIFLGGMYFIDYFITKYTSKNNINFKEYIFQFMKKAIFFIPFFIPLVFYYINYGTFSLIASKGYVKIDGIIKKIVSLFFDLNQGIVVFMPIFILIFFIILFSGLIKKNVKALLNMITILVIISVCSLQMNWNAGESGIMRYSIWIIPILVYFMVIYKDKFLNSNFNTIIEKLIIVSIFFTGSIIISTGLFEYKYSYLEFNPLTKYVLDVAPSIYNPQEEVFAERALHKEYDYYNELPIIYSNEDKSVRKVLMNNSCIENLQDIIECDDKIINEKIDKYKNHSGLYYLNFKNEDVRFKEAIKIKQQNRKFEIKIINELPELKINKEYLIKLSVRNLGEQTWKEYKYNIGNPIGVSYHWIDQNNKIVIYDGVRTYIQKDIEPNKDAIVDTKIITPTEKGNYKLEFDIVQENVAWFAESNEIKYTFNVKIN